MNLREYIRKEGQGTSIDLCTKLGVSKSYLSQMAHGTAPISPIRSVALELATEGRIKRWECRPLDWWLIWPEYLDTPGTPRIAKARRHG